MVLAMVIGLPFAISIVLLIPSVQTSLVRVVTNRLSQDLSAEISVKSVRVLPYAGIRLSGFLMLDQEGDTLFYADRVRTGIDDFSIRHKHLYLKKVHFYHPVIQLKEVGEKMNFTFLLDSLGKNSSDSVKWHYSLKGLRIDKGDVTFSHSILLDQDIFSHNRLHFSELNLEANRKSDINDTLVFEITNFFVKEDIGLGIEGLQTTGKVLEDKIVIDNLAFHTQKSSFDIGLLEIPLQHADAAGNAVSFRTEARQLVIDPSEIRLFIPDFPLIDQAITFSGLVYGNLDNLKGRDVKATIGKATYISTNFDINDFSNFKQAFLYLDIESSQTTVEDLELLFPGDKKVFPASFESLGIIRYQGNITGFISDLVAFGIFTSDLGNLKTDIGIKLYDYQLIFGGGVSTQNFNLGKLLGEETQLGKLSFDLDIKGQRKSSTDYFVFVDGNVDRLNFKEYLYKNISIQGLLTHQKFDGQFKVDDFNGKVDFAGSVDFSAQIPSFNFTAELRNLQLDRLNLLPSLPDGVLSLNMQTDIRGDHLDDLVGSIILSDGLLSSPSGIIDFDTVSVSATRIDNGKRLVLKSPFAEGHLEGRYSFRDLEQTMYYYVSKFLPSPVSAKYKKLLASDNNDFTFEIVLKSMRNPFKFFIPQMDISDRGFAKGRFSPSQGIFDMEASLGMLDYNNIKGEDLNLRIFSTDASSASLTFRSVNTQIGGFLDLPNLSIHQKMWNDSLTTNVFWNNWDNITNSGALYSEANFRVNKDEKLITNLTLSPSTIIVGDSTWNIHESIISFHPEGLSVKGFRIDRYPQYVSVDGFLHRELEDELVMRFNGMDISQFLKGTDVGKISFGGFVDGALKLKNYYREPLLSSNIDIKSFEFNRDPLGTFHLSSSWNRELEALEIETSLKEGEIERLSGGGFFYPSEKRFDISADLDSMRIGFLDPFLNTVMQNLEGSASGKVYFKGELSQPYLTGRVKLNEGSFDVEMLNTTYYIKDSVILFPHEIRFDNMTLADRYNQKGKFKGSIYHSGSYGDMRYDLRVDANKMMVMNTRWQNNPYYYGTIFGDATLLITGSSENIDIGIKGRTRSGTRFFIPVQNKDRIGESSFIRFTNGSGEKLEDQSTPTGEGVYKVDLSGVKLDMDIEVTPDAEVQIIFDERVGDILRSRGGGNIQIRINRQGDIKFYGDYTIQEGEYLFSLQNLINKRFDIVQGGTVKWQGDPYNADINIMAVYKLKASLSDLLGESVQDRSDLQRRVQIHSNLMLSGMLQQPIIKFGIELPTLDEGREALVLDYMATEEEMNRQVLSLLVLNKFYTPEYMRSEQGGTETYNNAALLTTTEMLSSQISKWMSSISNDFDLGVAYRPGDNITSEEFELALSTQVFNNRVSLNGNVGVGKYQANTSTMIGDFDVDIKLNKSGTIRARAYTRSNEDYLYESSLTTQGVGISFKEEFDQVKELIRKYWRMVAVRRDDENK